MRGFGGTGGREMTMPALWLAESAWRPAEKPPAEVKPFGWAYPCFEGVDRAAAAALALLVGAGVVLRSRDARGIGGGKFGEALGATLALRA